MAAAAAAGLIPNGGDGGTPALSSASGGSSGPPAFVGAEFRAFDLLAGCGRCCCFSTYGPHVRRDNLARADRV